MSATVDKNVLEGTDLKDPYRNPFEEHQAKLLAELAERLADGPLEDVWEDFKFFFDDDWELGRCPECECAWGQRVAEDPARIVIYSRCEHEVPSGLERKVRERYPAPVAIHVRNRLDATLPPSVLAPMAQVALCRRNGDEPVLYQRGGEFARVVGCEVRPLREVEIGIELADAADWRANGRLVDPPPRCCGRCVRSVQTRGSRRSSGWLTSQSLHGMGH
jgi:hypothetical protein